MNSQEARQVLEGYRPGREDDNPRVAEALQCAASDPALGRWWAAQLRFDNTMSAAVHDIPVPADLKHSLLAARHVGHGRQAGSLSYLVKVSFWKQPWQIPGNWRGRIAAAAAVVVLAGVAGFLATQPRATFAGFRQELIAHDWAGDPHLDLESSDLPKIKAYLAARHAVTNFTLPPGLNGSHIAGCRVFERAGETVSLICLAEGPRHLHLFVLDRATFPDLPPSGLPDFEKCAGWKTASWRHGDQTYILTGMKFHAFVMKFRKAGRWTMSG